MRLSKSWLKEINREAPDAQGASPAEPAAPAAAPVVAAEPALDLSFIPADFHTDGKPDLARFQAHYAELTAPKAVPDAYDFAVPADFKPEGLDLPEGMTFAIDAKNPAVAPILEELNATLKAMGAPAEVAPKMAAMLARYEATKLAEAYALKKQSDEALEAERKLLGTPAQAEARITAVQRLLETTLPEDQVKALSATIGSAKALQALEKLLQPKGLGAPIAAAPTFDDDIQKYYANPSR